MASEVGICNAAFHKLGQPPILSFSEDSKAARLANERYAEVRDLLISEHQWNFAMERTELAALSDGPAWGYAFYYQLPTGYVRMFEVNGEDEGAGKWKVEGTKIATDLTAPLQIRYVKSVTDPESMSAGFREALAARLAADWAEEITGDENVRTEKRAEAVVAVAKAKSSDGQEGIPDAFKSNRWINSRL